jgi:hypothetical protein
MIVLPYIMAGVIGWLIIHPLLSKEFTKHLAFKIFLSLNLGLGICALLTFLTFICFNQFSRPAILTAHGLLIILLIIINFKKIIRIPDSSMNSSVIHKKHDLWDSLIWTIWIALSLVIWRLAHEHVYGEWDAWALWNMKTKFLVSAGPLWKNIFELHWHTQPDYPLLLPFINTWIYAVSGQDLRLITLATAVVLSLQTGLLLYYGLRLFAARYLTFLASSILLFNPYYIFLGTSQYADILLASYLLSSLMIFSLLILHQCPSLAFLSGLYLGLMSFTKNEGIIMAVILMVILAWSITRLNDRFLSKELIKNFLRAFVLIGALMIYFKLFLAPPNRDMLTANIFLQSKFFNLSGLTAIGQFIIEETFHARWFGAWIYIILLMITGSARLFQKEYKPLTCFFLIYILFLLLIYLFTINFDLSWRLSRTLPRIYFYMLPSFVFFAFYLHADNTHPKQDNAPQDNPKS